MKDIDIQIPIGDPNPVPAQSQPDPHHQSGASFLSRSSHPIACLFHIILKSLTFLCYLFLNLIIDNTPITFIIIILFTSIDFWATQNIIGRLLVGLRCRNLIQEDGTQTWIYENFDDNRMNNKVDSYVFWTGMIVMPILWGVFFIANFLTFNLFWSLLVLTCCILSTVNLIEFIRCRKDHKQKMKEMISRGVSVGMQKMMSS